MSTQEPWGRFQPLSHRAPYRLIWRSFGPEKVGKNHFGFTAPGPIAVQSFDIGLEGVVEKFLAQGKDIRSIDYEYERGKTGQEEAIELRDRFIEDYEVALTQARTIVWDETELWELCRTAELPTNTQGVATDAPVNYTRLNAMYRGLIQRAYATDVNLQLIQKVKEKWGTIKKQKFDGRMVDSPYPTGEFEPFGFKEVGYLVQANIKHTWDKEHGFGVHVLNCRQNMTLADETYYNTDFPTIAQLVFEDSQESDWL